MKVTYKGDYALKAIFQLALRHDEEGDELSDKEIKDLDRMKATAGVKVDTVAPKNEYTESLRIAAGLK